MELLTCKLSSRSDFIPDDSDAESLSLESWGKYYCLIVFIPSSQQSPECSKFPYTLLIPAPFSPHPPLSTLQHYSLPSPPPQLPPFPAGLSAEDVSGRESVCEGKEESRQ